MVLYEDIFKLSKTPDIDSILDFLSKHKISIDELLDITSSMLDNLYMSDIENLDIQNLFEILFLYVD